ncbi:MAG: glutamate--cysteine ligase [Planctomycetes bacterium]|nr:glutamate--cysteine ligase [Planctomycetota bacterium]
MGQDISVSHFKYHDFQRFERLLQRELELLRLWLHEGRFSTRRSIGGLELEAWIVDAQGQPVPLNEELLARVNSPAVVPELSRFNIEFNVDPQPLAGRGLERLETELGQTWDLCHRTAAEWQAGVVAIGTLPTVTESQLSLRNMSAALRYRALNEQTLRLRQGRPLRLDITGRERLQTEHLDVMLEAGTTSFQLHLQVPVESAVRYYNASQIISAPLVAVAANSPFLFGKCLWDETRIPLFEQAVDVGQGRFPRVTFGSGYAERSLEECFAENHDHYPIMLPWAMEETSDQLAHLRLHNGTIWRWNRALIGFDAPGQPHLRIEQRVPAAGPTTLDMAANMAFFYGLVEALATTPVPPETRLPFTSARANFYLAARYGLEAELVWLDRAATPIRSLILDDLLPLARQGLAQLTVAGDVAERLLGVIAARVNAGQNGAVWQRRFVTRHGSDMALLTREYRIRQQAGSPVHTWDL